MLTEFYAHNYKALRTFTLGLLGDLTVLAGANGAGKSSVCEAMDLSLRLVDERPDPLLKELEAEDLLTNKWIKPKKLSFRWHVAPEEGQRPLSWRIDVAKRKHWGVSRERAGTVTGDGRIAVCLRRDGQVIQVKDELSGEWTEQRMRLPSFLSTLVEDQRGSHPTLWALRDTLKGWYVPFLNPRHLRRRSRSEALGGEGQNFARFLYELRERDRAAFDQALDQVRQVFPGVTGVQFVRTRYGWTELQVKQSVAGKGKKQDAVFKAAQVNDGLLRLLALAASPYAEEGMGLLLIEEPENGMHPRLLEHTLEVLRRMPVQVVVTTHSPVLLNFARPEEVVVLKGRGARGPVAAPFTGLRPAMRRMGYLNVGDVLYNIDDERLFEGWE